MRISDWSSDVCSSDLPAKKRGRRTLARRPHLHGWRIQARQAPQYLLIAGGDVAHPRIVARRLVRADAQHAADLKAAAAGAARALRRRIGQRRRPATAQSSLERPARIPDEHTPPAPLALDPQPPPATRSGAN